MIIKLRKPRADYGGNHQRTRRRLHPHGTPCAYCGKPIHGNNWDLAHDPHNPSSYLGAAHVACNRGHKPIVHAENQRGGSNTSGNEV